MTNEIGIKSNFLEIGTQVMHPDHGVQVQIEPIRPNSMVLVGAWPNSLDLVETKINSVCGIKPEQITGRCTCSEETIIVYLTPGRFLLISDSKDLHSKLSDLMMPNASTVLDLQHNRIGFRISGSLAKTVLMKGVAVDTSDTSFPESSAIQTAIDHVACLIVRSRLDKFDIYVPSSFGQSFAHWLTDASLEYGYDIGDFGNVISK